MEDVGDVSLRVGRGEEEETAEDGAIVVECVVCGGGDGGRSN